MRALAAVFCALLAAAAGAAPAPAEYDIAVRIEPAERTLEGTATIVIHDRGAMDLRLGRRFAVESVELDGKALDRAAHAWRVPPGAASRRMVVRWRGALAALDTSLDHRQVLGNAQPVAGERGTFLPASSRWYPLAENALASYRVAIDLPAGQRGIVPGRLVEETERGGRRVARFDFPHPAEGIDLMAGPYGVEERVVTSRAGRPLALRTYFHAEVAALAASYLDSVAEHLARYERVIGDYPFAGFSVVSSPTPTGFGMPALTYLGIDVLRLPFIRATSLGHEVLHNWWGNGVYPDYRRGNWSEGLTTFMADYAYEEARSEAAARDMRLAWLRDFAAVPPAADRPLADFVSRSHAASQVIGYHKAAMVFFMLRDQIGAEAFGRGLVGFWETQRHRIAGWNELRGAFERAAGRDLAGFFEQWLARPGAPALAIAAATRVAGDAPRLRITLTQALPAYAVAVPLRVITAAGEEMHRVELAVERATFVLELRSPPLAVALDPDLRLFRRLAPDEAPAILRQAMLDPEVRTVLLGEGATAQAGRALAARLLEQGVRERDPGERLAGPTLVIGLEAEIDAWLARQGLPPRPAEVAGAGTARVWALRQADGSALAIIAAVDAAALGALARPLPHHGRQSWLVFDGSRAAARGLWPSQPVVKRVD